MGGTLRFSELRGKSGDSLKRGVKILDRSALREHVDDQLSTSLDLNTSEGTEYPTYDYLHGLEYGHRDRDPFEPFFIDNVYPDTYDDLFAGLSEYTGPFVVLAAQSFPRLDEMLEGTTSTPYLIYAKDGRAEQVEVELPDIPDLESEMRTFPESLGDDE